MVTILTKNISFHFPKANNRNIYNTQPMPREWYLLQIFWEFILLLPGGWCSLHSPSSESPAVGVKFGICVWDFGIQWSRGTSSTLSCRLCVCSSRSLSLWGMLGESTGRPFGTNENHFFMKISQNQKCHITIGERCWKQFRNEIRI